MGGGFIKKGGVLDFIVDPFNLFDNFGLTKKEKTAPIKETNQAADIEKQTKEAEALAAEEARQKSLDKLRRQTRTVFTSGLGVLGTQTNSQNSTLGKSNV